MKNGWKIAYLIVYDTIKYGRNTVHIKRFIYDYSRPFTAVLIQPGELLNLIDQPNLIELLDLLDLLNLLIDFCHHLASITRLFFLLIISCLSLILNFQVHFRRDDRPSNLRRDDKPSTLRHDDTRSNLRHDNKPSTLHRSIRK
jgi:hypothetical protein